MIMKTNTLFRAGMCAVLAVAAGLLLRALIAGAKRRA